MKKPFLYFLAIIMMLATTIQAQISTNGLVASYLFSGNVKDSSGNGNDGINYGAALTTDRFGIMNRAYRFYNDQDSITIPISSTVLGNNYSISTWVYLDTIGSTYPSFIRSNWGLMLQYSTANNNYTNGFAYYTAIASGNGGKVCYSGNTNSKQWYNIVITNANQSCSMYLNGILQSTQYPLFTNGTGTCLKIGGNSRDESFIGKVDDIRIYNRALDTAEVQALYNDGGYTLPITIDYINASPKGNLVSVDWRTAAEVNTNNFNIQHSNNGESFIDIGILKAIGYGANSYSFVDDNPSNGTNYYRLKSIDKDGSSAISKTVMVKVSDKQSFTIIPNPAKDFATIKFSKTVVKATIEVYDITGKKVITQSLIESANNYKLNTKALMNGVYMIKVNTDAGNNIEKLIIYK